MAGHASHGPGQAPASQLNGTRQTAILRFCEPSSPVLSLAWGRSGAVLGAVQEHRGDQCRGFLDAGLVLGGHAGCGLEQLAEQELQFTGGDLTAERAVVGAALQQRLEQRPDLEICMRQTLQSHNLDRANIRSVIALRLGYRPRWWLDDGLTTRQASTVENYRRLADHAIGKLGAVKLKDLTALSAKLS
jgi:hypothetical protein